ncbi:uncharacterized protein BDW70DRAFT_140680 [Aspergillus foveolatus]|uniref:uncharacterized protein n=1 Tax=Aspergillus foveolatus TaxID=210207 RepID=UPI003CCCDF20
MGSLKRITRRGSRLFPVSSPFSLTYEIACVKTRSSSVRSCNCFTSIDHGCDYNRAWPPKYEKTVIGRVDSLHRLDRTGPNFLVIRSLDADADTSIRPVVRHSSSPWSSYAAMFQVRGQGLEQDLPCRPRCPRSNIIDPHHGRPGELTARASALQFKLNDADSSAWLVRSCRTDGGKKYMWMDFVRPTETLEYTN